ncbi:type VI secretion system Vgr family protein [Aquitalea denitrificans]|uniref:type VI secretion system Vgr family protein n=1 Tax=Aquitalea denitrificans TaxID=519081 RepID=UPI00135C376C|nr:type VI secretion system Vgr family protein [Aquitalea denitrificans]
MPNPYQLAFPDRLGLDLSVFAFTLDEALDTPFLLEVSVTSPQADLPLACLIHQPVTFTITPPQANPLPLIPGLTPPPTPDHTRRWQGLVRAASRLHTNQQETRYRFRIGPPLAALADGRHTRLFQQQSIPAVIAAVLQQHGLAGSALQLDLTADYPLFEHITQYRESDLDFIQRLAADAGLFYQAIPADDGRALLAFGDNLEHYQRGLLPMIPLSPDAGLEGVGREVVRRFDLHHQPMLHSVQRRDFNYRSASTPLASRVDSPDDTPAAHGLDDDWGEGQRNADEGLRLALLRHQLSLSRQCRGEGAGNVLRCRPGAVLTLSQAFAEAPHGWLLTAVRHQGARDQAYHNQFSVIPADRIWRPALRDKPRIHGTLPAMVVSPANNSYRYPFLDADGRYRVRFLFDLDAWPPGSDSRPVRLAKPFAGGGFGLHLPLHAGTRVNIAFTDGDIDRPYIASAMHDSSKPDHIDSGWHTRNVILTRAHNKLRMEDLQGKEHIKLATEYGKTQLNIGHLVDAQRQPRGEGFELRSDQWGAIRAGKGLLLSAHAQPGASGLQRDMAQALQQLERANQSIDSLNSAASQAKADPLQLQAQLDLLNQQVKDLQQAVLLASAPAGMALTTGGSLHAAAGQDIALTAQQHVGVSALKSLVVNIGQAISLFAAKAGIKLVANQGNVDIQAQGGAVLLSSRQDTQIRSMQKISLAAQEEIVLSVGGNALRITAEGISTLGKTTVYGGFSVTSKQQLSVGLPDFPVSQVKAPLPFVLAQSPFGQTSEWAGMPYTLKAGAATVQQGLMSDAMQLPLTHEPGVQHYTLTLANGSEYQIPLVSELRDPAKGQLANAGLHKQVLGPAPDSGRVTYQTDARTHQAQLLKSNDDEEPQA